ncbi:hypothetical protein AAG906_009214 [Vitis piasezkii]
MEQRIVTPEQQKWVSKLLGYDYEITYKPGRENSAADALSRPTSIPTWSELASLPLQILEHPTSGKMVCSFLPWAKFWYNTHTTYWDDPFQALYGRPPPSIPSYQVGASYVNEVDRTLWRLKGRDMEFQVGIWSSLNSILIAESIYRRAYQKLANRFYDPYQIEEKVGKAGRETKATITELPSLTDDGEIIMEPEAILNTRWVKKGSSFVEESLVRWKNFQKKMLRGKIPELHNKYINLNLEDKVR